MSATFSLDRKNILSACLHFCGMLVMMSITPCILRRLGPLQIYIRLGRFMTSLLSLEITAADSYTHKSPMCMHLKVFL